MLLIAGVFFSRLFSFRIHRRLPWMLLLGSFGDGRLYVSFNIERGTWRLACVVMIDVVVELEMLMIADVLLFRVFVFRIHHHHNHTKFHLERITTNPERPRPHHLTMTTTTTTTTTTFAIDASWLLRRWQNVRII
jgi:hypothetical protein